MRSSNYDELSCCNDILPRDHYDGISLSHMLPEGRGLNEKLFLQGVVPRPSNLHHEVTPIYAILRGDNNWFASFSLNLPPKSNTAFTYLATRQYHV
jgi:hypothetical protein